MNRTLQFLGLTALIFWACGLVPRAAMAQPTITNPRVNCVAINGRTSGTINSTFVFRAEVVPSANQGLLGVWVYIDPSNVDNPEQSLFVGAVIPMSRDGLLSPPSAPNGFEACVPGSTIAPEIPG